MAPMTPWMLPSGNILNDSHKDKFVGLVGIVEFPNGRKYICRHVFGTGTESYVGSGTKVREYMFENKRNTDGIVRRIHSFHDSRSELKKAEAGLIRERDAVASNEYMNLVENGGISYAIGTREVIIIPDVGPDAGKKIIFASPTEAGRNILKLTGFNNTDGGIISKFCKGELLTYTKRGIRNIYFADHDKPDDLKRLDDVRKQTKSQQIENIKLGKIKSAKANQKASTRAKKSRSVTNSKNQTYEITIDKNSNREVLEFKGMYAVADRFDLNTSGIVTQWIYGIVKSYRKHDIVEIKVNGTVKVSDPKPYAKLPKRRKPKPYKISTFKMQNGKVLKLKGRDGVMERFNVNYDRANGWLAGRYNTWKKPEYGIASITHNGRTRINDGDCSMPKRVPRKSRLTVRFADGRIKDCMQYNDVRKDVDIGKVTLNKWIRGVSDSWKNHGVAEFIVHGIR